MSGVSLPGFGASLPGFGASSLGSGSPAVGGGRGGRVSPIRSDRPRVDATTAGPATAAEAPSGAWSLDQATRQALAEVGWVPSSTYIRATSQSTSFRFSLANPAFGATIEGSFYQQTLDLEATIDLEPAPGTQAFARATVRLRFSMIRASAQASWGGQGTSPAAAEPAFGRLQSGQSPYGALTELIQQISDIARQDGRKRVTLALDDPGAVGALAGKGSSFARRVMDLIQMVVVASEIAYADEPDVTCYTIHVRGPKGSGSGSPESVPATAAFAASFELTHMELSLSAEVTVAGSEATPDSVPAD